MRPMEQPVPESTCGYSGKIAANGIRNSPDTSLFGEFPWTVMILENMGDNAKTYICSGSLIHPQVVLTAAHCVNDSTNYTIRAGDWDIRNKKEPYPYQSQEVQTVIRHPQFNEKNFHYDAALIILSEPFKLTDNVNVICMSNQGLYQFKLGNNECAASGWGIDQFTETYKKIMKRVEFYLVQHKACEERFRTMTHLGKWFELHRSFICAFGQNGYDVCKRDGGGPLVCPIPGTPDRHQLVGITSWGVGCAGKTPSVFTRVSEIKSWIDGWFYIFKYSKDYEYESVPLVF